MSIVDKDHCACGKLFSEENPDCVFNYHKKKDSKVITIIEIKTKEKLPEYVVTMCVQEIITKLYIYDINGGDINIKT